MKLISDPAEVERLAEELAEENWAFRNWIKLSFGFDDRRLMSVVHRLTEDVTARIDCTACANCCRETPVLVDKADMERLARHLDSDVQTLRSTYLQRDEQKHWQLPAPCPLLAGNLCSVYDARPSTCRQYPHLHNDFRAHSIARIQETFICPIVFNVVEGMKAGLDWSGEDELDWLGW